MAPRKLRVTRHAGRMIRTKGFDMADVRAVFATPEHTSRVRSRSGQVRLIGRGLVLVGEWVKLREHALSVDVFTLVTVYVDRDLTPPRPDQLRTPEGRRYAARYEAGKGRG